MTDESMEPVSERDCLTAGDRLGYYVLTNPVFDPRRFLELTEAVLREDTPGLLDKLYPRRYEESGGYYSPRLASLMLGSAYAESLPTVPADYPNAHRLINPSLPYLAQHRMPTFFMAPELLKAIELTDFEGLIDWSRMPLPFESGILMLPREGLLHAIHGHCAFILYTRLRKGLIPKLIPQQPITLDQSLDLFGLVALCLNDIPMPGNPPQPREALLRLEPKDGGSLAGVLGRAGSNCPVWLDSVFALERLMRLRGNFRIKQPMGVFDAPLQQADSDFLARAETLAIGTLLALTARPELLTPARLLRTVKAKNKKEGQPQSVEWWSPNIIGRDYRLPQPRPRTAHEEPHETHGTHASPRLHWRRGHYREQAFGPKWQLHKTIWIEPSLIGSGQHEKEQGSH